MALWADWGWVGGLEKQPKNCIIKYFLGRVKRFYVVCEKHMFFGVAGVNQMIFVCGSGVVLVVMFEWFQWS